MVGLAWVLMFAAAPVQAQTDDGQKVYQRALKGTVWILAKKGERTASGTGSLIDRNRRLVVTNFHVAGDADRLVVVFADFNNGKPVSERSHYWDMIRQGKGIRAKLVELDANRDLAIIH